MASKARFSKKLSALSLGTAVACGVLAPTLASAQTYNTNAPHPHDDGVYLNNSWGPTNIPNPPKLDPETAEKEQAWAKRVVKCAGAAAITAVTGGATAKQMAGACAGSQL